MSRRTNYIEGNDNFRDQNLRFVRNDLEDNMNQFFGGADGGIPKDYLAPQRDSIIVQPTPGTRQTNKSLRYSELQERREYLSQLGLSEGHAHAMATATMQLPDFNLRNIKRERYHLSFAAGDDESRQANVDASILSKITAMIDAFEQVQRHRQQQQQQRSERPCTPPPPTNINWNTSRESSPNFRNSRNNNTRHVYRSDVDDRRSPERTRRHNNRNRSHNRDEGGRHDFRREREQRARRGVSMERNEEDLERDERLRDRQSPHFARSEHIRENVQKFGREERLSPNFERHDRNSERSDRHSNRERSFDERNPHFHRVGHHFGQDDNFHGRQSPSFVQNEQNLKQAEHFHRDRHDARKLERVNNFPEAGENFDREDDLRERQQHNFERNNNIRRYDQNFGGDHPQSNSDREGSFRVRPINNFEGDEAFHGMNERFNREDNFDEQRQPQNFHREGSFYNHRRQSDEGNYNFREMETPFQRENSFERQTHNLNREANFGEQNFGRNENFRSGEFINRGQAQHFDRSPQDFKRSPQNFNQLSQNVNRSPRDFENFEQEDDFHRLSAQNFNEDYVRNRNFEQNRFRGNSRNNFDETHDDDRNRRNYDNPHIKNRNSNFDHPRTLPNRDDDHEQRIYDDEPNPSYRSEHYDNYNNARNENDSFLRSQYMDNYESRPRDMDVPYNVQTVFNENRCNSEYNALLDNEGRLAEERRNFENEYHNRAFRHNDFDDRPLPENSNNHGMKSSKNSRNRLTKQQPSTRGSSTTNNSIHSGPTTSTQAKKRNAQQSAVNPVGNTDNKEPERARESSSIPAGNNKSQTTGQQIIGFCVKSFKVNSNEKFFINVCQAPEVPKPKDVTDEELINILESVEPGSFRVPMSISEIRNTKDRSNNTVEVCDIAVNPKFMLKIKESQLFNNFFLQIVAEALHEKYNIQIAMDKPIILNNRKFIGTLVAHRVRNDDVQRAENSNEGFITNPNQLAPGQSTKPSGGGQLVQEIDEEHAANIRKLFAKSKEPEYKLRARQRGEIIDEIYAELYLPNCVSSQDFNLDVGEDRILVESPQHGYIFDKFVNYRLNQERAKALFDKTTKMLQVRIPILTA